MGIINLSSGSELAPSKALSANNLYLVTIEQRGVTAGTNGATLVVSGTYTIKESIT